MSGFENSMRVSHSGNFGVGKTYEDFIFSPFQLWRARMATYVLFGQDRWLTRQYFIQLSRATYALQVLRMEYKPDTKTPRRTDDRRLAKKDIDGNDLRNIRTY